MAIATARVPPAPAREGLPSLGLGGIRELLVLRPFRRMLLVAAFVIGSHALHDGFAVIRWREAGISPAAISLLWSEAVASEVLVFVFAGPWLLARLGTSRAALLAAGLGVLRWSAMASTAAIPVLIVIQPLHGLTFALLHLAAMHLIAEHVPERVAATAQTLYGTLGLGAASAFLTVTGGALYGYLGPGAFWAMAALCVIALPFAAGLRKDQP